MDAHQGRRENSDFVEIMACPGGCINGGGQPLQLSDVRNWVDFKAETRQVPSTQGDREKSFIRKAHNNPDRQEALQGIPRYGRRYASAHQLLHTHYTDRSDV